MNTYNIALGLHIAAGSLALLSFWCAGMMRKGTPLHRRIGQIYLLAMLLVIVSGVPLVLGLLARDKFVSASFLGYLLILTSNTCSNAWRAIRDRRDYRRYYGSIFWLLSGLSAAAGLGMIALGFTRGAPLLWIFGSIGVISLLGAFAARRRAPHTPNWWLREHYGAMIGNGVATHIAFFAIGLRNAFPAVDPAIQQSLAWFGPLLASVIAGVWLNRKYGRTRRVPAAAQGSAHPSPGFMGDRRSTTG
jgi:uncharacterized membrane protein